MAKACKPRGARAARALKRALRILRAGVRHAGFMVEDLLSCFITRSIAKFLKYEGG